MELLDSLSLYLMTQPEMADQLGGAFILKHLLLFGLAIFFILLPYREQKKEIKRQKELSKTPGHFLA